MSYKKIIVEKNEQIAIITLNQPAKLNAMSLEMKNEVYDGRKLVPGLEL